MTKLKLRNIAITGVMALGIAAIKPNLIKAQDYEPWNNPIVYSGSEDGTKGKAYKIKFYGYSDLIAIIADKEEPIFYTDVKNAKTKIPAPSKWIRAEYNTSREYDEYDNIDGKQIYYNTWLIDVSSYTKETVIYIANTTSPKSEDILAVTIPERPTLKANLVDQTADGLEAFSFTTDYTTIEPSNNDKYRLKVKAKVKLDEEEQKERLAVKLAPLEYFNRAYWCFEPEKFEEEYGWECWEHCYKLPELQKKGATLNFRLSAIYMPYFEAMSGEELTARGVIATKGAVTAELPRYKLVSAGSYGKPITALKALSVRASAMSTVKIPKKANAPVANIDYDNFTVTINKGQYAILTEEQFNGMKENEDFDINAPWNSWEDHYKKSLKYKPVNIPESSWKSVNKATTINIPQNSFTYIAIKIPEDTINKKPESNISYLALGGQEKYGINSGLSNTIPNENEDVVVVSSLNGGAEISITGIQGEIYQYCYGSDLFNNGQLNTTKTKWFKLANSSTKNKIPQIATKTATISKTKLDTSDTILVRKASNKSLGKFSSTYLIFTKNSDGIWVRTEQGDTINQYKQITIGKVPVEGSGIPIKGAVTFNNNNVICELPITNIPDDLKVDNSKISVKCGTNIIKGEDIVVNLTDDKQTLKLTIPRTTSNGLKAEKNLFKFTVTLDAGAIYENGSNKLSPSNKCVSKFTFNYESSNN